MCNNVALRRAALAQDTIRRAQCQRAPSGKPDVGLPFDALRLLRTPFAAPSVSEHHPENLTLACHEQARSVAKGASNGGGAGNRTRVRRAVPAGSYERFLRLVCHGRTSPQAGRAVASSWSLPAPYEPQGLGKLIWLTLKPARSARPRERRHLRRWRRPECKLRQLWFCTF